MTNLLVIYHFVQIYEEIGDILQIHDKITNSKPVISLNENQTNQVLARKEWTLVLVTEENIDQYTPSFPLWRTQ